MGDIFGGGSGSSGGGGSVISSIGTALANANQGSDQAPVAQAPQMGSPAFGFGDQAQPQTAGDYIMQLLSTIGQNKPDPRASYLGVLGLL